MFFDERVWYRIYVCPHCGYKSHVTNMCRKCNEEADYKSTSIHGEPIRISNMRASDWVTRFNPRLRRQERRKAKNLPENAIIR